MRTNYDRQLKKLNDEMVEMGSMIEGVIEKAIKALVNQDVDLAQEVIRRDDQIDQQEKDIESLCFKLLLMEQPVATDLRQVSSALIWVTDMERIGDQAADISELTIQMAGKPYVKELEHIKAMAKESMVMLVDSIEAYVNLDLTKARKVIAQDDVVDDLFIKVKSELINLIHRNADAGEQETDLLMVAKYLERIGDHATNISEWVIYNITGDHISGKLLSYDIQDQEGIVMRCIWNMTADAGKGKSKQHLIKMFLLLNSIVWGVIAVVVAVTLKGIGLMSSWSMAESILVSAGYGICLVGLIGGTVCILLKDGPDRTYLEQRQEEH